MRASRVGCAAVGLALLGGTGWVLTLGVQKVRMAAQRTDVY